LSARAKAHDANGDRAERHTDEIHDEILRDPTSDIRANGSRRGDAELFS
jgi:hypothetical protein